MKMAVRPEMRARFRLAKQIGLGVNEARQSARERPIAAREPLRASQSAAEALRNLHMRRSKQVDAQKFSEDDRRR